jgi:hypothetical protein
MPTAHTHTSITKTPSAQQQHRRPGAGAHHDGGVAVHVVHWIVAINTTKFLRLKKIKLKSFFYGSISNSLLIYVTRC